MAKASKASGKASKAKGSKASDKASKAKGSKASGKASKAKASGKASSKASSKGSGKAKGSKASGKAKGSKAKGSKASGKASGKVSGKGSGKGGKSSKAKAKGSKSSKASLPKVKKASGDKKALVLIDLQNDFCPGGSLAVANGHKTAPVANALMNSDLFDYVVATQDWHPQDHGSFASNNEGMDVYSVGELGGLPQTMWPDHCVQGSEGAEFLPSLEQDNFDKVFKKGTDKSIDSYSGFYDNGHLKSTGMGEWLVKKGVGTTYVMGIATDFCVKFSAVDSVSVFDFETYLIEDACYGVNLNPNDCADAIKEMKKKGIKLTTSTDLLGFSVDLASSASDSASDSASATGSGTSTGSGSASLSGSGSGSGTGTGTTASGSGTGSS